MPTWKPDLVDLLPVFKVLYYAASKAASLGIGVSFPINKEA